MVKSNDVDTAEEKVQRKNHDINNSGRKSAEEKTMILITGGAFQGKSETAKQLYSAQENGKEPLILEGKTDEMELLKKADIILHFHLWIRSLLEEGKDPYAMTEQLLKANPRVLITMNQMGCGIVPMGAFDRKYRETVGRIGCLLAKQAQEAYLVNCGIAKRLK